MTKFFFGITLFLSSVTTLAQNTAQDLNWFKSFSRPTSNAAFLKELPVAQRNLQDAVDSHDLATEAAMSKGVGLLYMFGQEDYEKAMDLFIRSLAIEDSLQLTQQKVITYLAIAEVFLHTGNLKKSDEALDQALVLNKTSEDQDIVAFILTKQGEIKTSEGELDAAEQSYKAVLNIVESINTPETEAKALFNLAVVYSKQDKLESALTTFKQALAIYRAEQDPAQEAFTLNEIGNLYALMKNHEKALANHVVSLEIRQRLKDKSALAQSYNNIGALYLAQKNLERAVANIDLALASAQAAQDQHEMRRSYDLLSLSFREARDFEKALRYRDLFVEMNDFIQRDINQQKLVDAEVNYQLEKRESQIDRLESIRSARERELAAERQMRSFLIALIGLAVVIALLVLYLYFVKRRTNKVLQIANDTVRNQNVQLTELNATKDKFFSIISHDLKGPLNSLTSFSGLLINHTDSLSKDEIKMLANDLDKSLKNLFALLENLLEWSRSQTGNIEFKSEPFDLTAMLQQNKELLSAQAGNKKITIENNVHSAIQVNAHRHSVNTVVRNLISNAIKFTPEGGKITLSAKPEQNRLVVSIADNGVGMSKEVIDKLFRIDTKHTTKGTANEKGTGLGLILCKDFIEKNGGKIWVTSEPGKGSVFSFDLPYQTADAHQPITV